MIDRQRIHNEKDLEKARKNNRFHRQEHLHDAIHAIHIKIVKWIPWLF